MWTEKEIWQLLEQVKDPEIPVLSLVDLGVITQVQVSPEQEVKVVLTPTFSGCPAMEYMRRSVEEVLTHHGITAYQVLMNFDNPWNSNKITEKGRQALKHFGLAPPPQYHLVVDLDILDQVSCPNCNSSNTSLRSPFGATLCRSVHYCHACRQMFEQFKPI